MDIDRNDVLIEGITSAIHSSLRFDEREQALSSEDLAWVNSCIVPDYEVPEHSWDRVREALLDVLSSQTVTNSEFSDSGVPGSPPGVVVEQMQDEEADGRDESELDKKKDEISDLLKEFQFENAFLPTYKEGDGVKENGAVDEEDDLGFFLYEDEAEPSFDEIFKVWELELPLEESDFDSQLTKALKTEPSSSNSVGSPYETLPLSADDDVAMAKWEDIKDVSLDNLIAGIADLSLRQFNN